MQISGLHEHVLRMLFKLIFLITGMPTGCDSAGVVWPFQFCSNSLVLLLLPDTEAMVVVFYVWLSQPEVIWISSGESWKA